MPVFVDALCSCAPNPRWQWQESCHLFAHPANLRELHEFAQSMRPRKLLFHPDARMPHYDLTASDREQAIALGAIPVTRRRTGEMIRIWRTFRS